MTFTDDLLVCADATVVALLVRGGATKVVAPTLAAAAAGELRSGRGPVPAAVIRALAIGEIAVVLAMAIPSLCGLAHVLLVLLGILLSNCQDLWIARLVCCDEDHHAACGTLWPSCSH